MVASLSLAGQAALAQSEMPERPLKVAQHGSSSQTTLRVKRNRGTLIIAASGPGTTYLAMAGDLAAAVGASKSLRILPIATDGGLATLEDLLLLRGVDLAIVPANVLAHARVTHALGKGLHRRVAYVAPLCAAQVHVVVGPGIATAADLRDKKVAIPLDDGTTEFTVKDIFQRLGIAIEAIAMETGDAVKKVRAGTIAAAMLVAGKPLPLVSGLPKDGSLRLLSVPFSAALGEGYSPGVLLGEDYPALIPPDAMVETVAVRAVLVASADKAGEETGRRVALHVPALFEAISRLAVSQRHPRWKDVNLGAVLPGWARVTASELWLRKANEQQRQMLRGDADKVLRAETRVKPSDLYAHQRKKVLDEFEAWAAKSPTSQSAAK